MKKIKVRCDYCGKPHHKKQRIPIRNKYNFCSLKCYCSFKKGTKNPDYARIKNDYKFTKQHRMNISKGRKGMKFTLEHRKNLGLSHKGKPGYWLGKKRSATDVRKFSKSHIGKKQSQITKNRKNEKLKNFVHTAEWNEKVKLSKIGNKNPMWGKFGKLHHMWTGNTPLILQIRHSTQYSNWRSDIFKRDDFTCTLCKTKGGRLEVDHYPIKFSSIFLSNNIKNMNDALKCNELWDINNGRTLCFYCHKKQHSKEHKNQYI